MKTALLQLCSGDDPEANLAVTQDLISEAVSQGARFVLTPEVTNCVSLSRSHQRNVLRPESEDITLAALRARAESDGLWILIGSLALAPDPGSRDTRFHNRSFLISPAGEIVARYDKIHMFDVTVSAEETYRESDGYRPGDKAASADLEGMRLGLSICYDLRFPGLYRALAKDGAQVLTVPSAFSPVTGAAHWQSLLRSRAIENTCYVLAPAQTGTHPSQTGKSRKTYGHSLAIGPWGEVLGDGGADPGITMVTLDPNEVKEARARIPSLIHDRDFERRHYGG